mmetsp:Transcript_16754/g.52531  ORF Transcript_16754/g.52531 Transcript_16754/m.52531 type:complete len:109 (-) Transcript_16754:154-480(-)
MRYIAAYLLLANAGKEANAANIKAVLSSVGIDADEEALNKVVSEMKGKTVEEMIAAGNEKLAAVPSGGAAAAGGAPAAAGGAAPAAEAKKEAVKEESSDDDMGFGLFD